MPSTAVKAPAILPPVQDFMTTRQVAARLGITRQGVHHLIRVGKLEPLEVGGTDLRPAALLFRRADVERLAAERAATDE